MASIVRIEERLVYEDATNPWVKLYFDRVQTPAGEQFRNRIVEKDGKSGVAILPITGASAGLVLSERYPIARDVWEIPRGFGEPDRPEDGPADEAARELEEETGLSGSWTSLGTVHPNSGLLASEVHLFAVVVDDPDHGRQKSPETLDFKWFPVDEVVSMIIASEITDVFTISAIFRAAGAGLIRVEL